MCRAPRRRGLHGTPRTISSANPCGCWGWRALEARSSSPHWPPSSRSWSASSTSALPSVRCGRVITTPRGHRTQGSRCAPVSSGSWRWSIRERVTGTPRRPVGWWFWRAATSSSWCFWCPAAGFRHPDEPRLVRAIDAVFVNAATQVLAPDGRPGLSLPVYLLAANSVLGTCVLDAVFAAGPLAAFQSALLIVDPLASIAIGVEPFEELLNNSPLDLLFGCSFAWPCSRGGAHDQVGADP